MKQPCHKCGRRRIGCHAGCEDYAEYKAEPERQREYTKKFQYIDPMNQTHEQEKKNRNRKYKGGNQ